MSLLAMAQVRSGQHLIIDFRPLSIIVIINNNIICDIITSCDVSNYGIVQHGTFFNSDVRSPIYCFRSHNNASINIYNWWIT